MRDTAQQLEQLQRILECYQQAIGHELPNQLVAIQGLAKIIQQSSDQLPAPMQELLQRLAQQAKRADQMVRSLAEVGRVVRSSEEPISIPLGDLWKQISLEIQLKLAPNRPTFEPPPDLPEVVVPRSALERALVELLCFRARHCPDPASLSFRWSTIPQEDSWVDLRISDQGGSLSPEEIQKWFDPWSHTSEDHHGEFGPTLARELVESWGGTLRVDAEEDVGCTLSVTLPRG